MEHFILIVSALCLFQPILCNHVHFPEEDIMEPETTRKGRSSPRSLGISSQSQELKSNDESWDEERTKALTFMASASGLDKENVVNPKISLFYHTERSDLNEQDSEVIRNNGNPHWQKVFKYMHHPGKNQTWKFKVKDVIAPDSEILLGEAVIKVDDYVGNGEVLTVKLLLAGEPKGELTIRQTGLITFKLSARNLARKDTFGGKSDPYVLVYWRRGPDGPDIQFAKTSQINNVVDAEWMDLITFEGYQKGSEQYWHFKLFDEDGFTKDDFLGEAFVNVDRFFDNMRRTRVKTIELVNEGKRKDGKGSLSIVPTLNS